MPASSSKTLCLAITAALLLTAAGAHAGGYLIDTTSWNAGTFGAGLDVQTHFYLRTIGDLAAASADGYTLLMNGFPMAASVAAQYTSVSDVAAIKAWLEAQPDHTATGLQVTASDDSTFEAGSVDTSAWTNAGLNLQPYSVTSACNTTAFMPAIVAINAAVPTACDHTLRDLFKGLYGAPVGTNCLASVAFLLTPHVQLCRQDTGIFTGSCTDGATGSAFMCDYVLSMAPPGAVGSGPVYSANADGSAVPSATQASSSTSASTLSSGSTPAPVAFGATPTPSGAAAGVTQSAFSVFLSAAALALAATAL